MFERIKELFNQSMKSGIVPKGILISKENYEILSLEVPQSDYFRFTILEVEDTIINIKVDNKSKEVLRIY